MAGAGDGEVTVHVELLARSMTLMQEGAEPEEQHPATASIYRLSRVPVHLRDKSSKDYTPGFAAIGPLHDRTDRRLRPAERLKMTYVNNLISRGHPDPSKHIAVLEDYVRVAAAREKEARAMYVCEEVADITVVDFIQMMVLDGCFIIEHLVNFALGREDPSVPSQISVDLILAENQLPFFVLVDMIAMTKLPELDASGNRNSPSVLLVKLVLYYFAGEKGRDLSELLPAADGVSHILHLLHEMTTTARIQWQPPSHSHVLEGDRAQAARRLLRRLPRLFAAPLLRRILPAGPRRRAWLEDHMPSASDMKRMGVQFKRGRGSGMWGKGIASVMGHVPLAVTLHENQLRLPQLLLEFRTAPLLLNLMAFEQSSREISSRNVSSYVAFMAKLVQSTEDARLLAEAGVVQKLGGLGNESMEEVARFFRVVGAANEEPGLLEYSYLRSTLEQLRRRSDSWVDVERNYLTFLAELLAVVTFVSSVSTIFQTYAAFKYH